MKEKKEKKYKKTIYVSEYINNYIRYCSKGSLSENRIVNVLLEKKIQEILK